MEIELRYVDDCPSWRLVAERVDRALSQLGLACSLTPVRVTSLEQAERIGFHGSPSVVVDGRDLFGDSRDPTSLSCRLFMTPEGPAGAPTYEQVLDALRAEAGAGA